MMTATSSKNGNLERRRRGVAVAVYAIYPTLYAIGVAAAVVLNNLHAPRAAFFYGFILLIFFIERIIPYEARWNRDDGQLSNDLLWYVINACWVPIYVASAGYWAALVEACRPPGLPDLWPGEAAWIIQFILSLLIFDGGQYLAHRASHEHRYLWLFHRVHHSSGRLSTANVSRSHPVEEMLHSLVTMTAPLLLGVPAEFTVLYFSIATVGSVLTHANIRTRCGVFNYLLSTPEIHRWHHSPVQLETNSNYGRVTVLYDHLFGSYYNPPKPARRHVGLDSAVPADIIGQFFEPFSVPMRRFTRTKPNLESMPARAMGHDAETSRLELHTRPYHPDQQSTREL